MAKDKTHKNSARARRRDQIVSYLGNPENEWLGRQRLTLEVLEYKNQTAIYQIFTVADLAEIEAEALAIRRKRLAGISVQVDAAVIKKAMDGDIAAAKLYYQRFEGWSEKQKVEHGVEDTLAAMFKRIDGRTRDLVNS